MKLFSGILVCVNIPPHPVARQFVIHLVKKPAKYSGISARICSWKLRKRLIPDLNHSNNIEKLKQWSGFSMMILGRDYPHYLTVTIERNTH
jgi:hypothetical protein